MNNSIGISKPGNKQEEQEDRARVAGNIAEYLAEDEKPREWTATIIGNKVDGHALVTVDSVADLIDSIKWRAEAIAESFQNLEFNMPPPRSPYGALLSTAIQALNGLTADLQQAHDYVEEQERIPSIHSGCKDRNMMSGGQEWLPKAEGEAK